MPSSKIPVLTLSVAAAAALTENQAVGYDGNVATAAQAMKGLACNDVDAGDQAAVDVLGTSICIAGGAFAVGGELEVGAAGKLVAKAAGVAVARALQAATADGDKAEVMLLP